MKLPIIPVLALAGIAFLAYKKMKPKKVRRPRMAPPKQAGTTGTSGMGDGEAFASPFQNNNYFQDGGGEAPFGAGRAFRGHYESPFQNNEFFSDWGGERAVGMGAGEAFESPFQNNQFFQDGGGVSPYGMAQNWGGHFESPFQNNDFYSDWGGEKPFGMQGMDGIFDVVNTALNTINNSVTQVLTNYQFDQPNGWFESLHSAKPPKRFQDMKKFSPAYAFVPKPDYFQTQYSEKVKPFTPGIETVLSFITPYQGGKNQNLVSRDEGGRGFKLVPRF